jgi:hypothetical protein
MPEISRFFGIVIKMFLDDHTPPHFHDELLDLWQRAANRQPLYKLPPLK